MRLAIIGGGGVRGPLLLLTLARRRERYNIEDVTVFDVDRKKTSVMIALARQLIDSERLPLRFRVCDTAKDALSGRDAVITTIREGFEEGRARDERICLDAGVIGQETTGAAGFAYAVRSVPVINEYVAIAGDSSPGAWVLNFTNPAGLVAQAAQRSGHPRVVGICDSADNAQKFAAKHLGVRRREVFTTVFGLNHLSWTSEAGTRREAGVPRRSAKREGGRREEVTGENLLPGLLADDGFMRAAQNVFCPETPRRLGLFCNEYLFYWYRTSDALAAMRAEDECRGERVLRLNRDLLADLGDRLDAGDAKGAAAKYDSYHHDRSETYMAYARAEGAPGHEFEIEGYAGVALDFLDSLQGEGVRMALNVPNGAAALADSRLTTHNSRLALEFLRSDDVVEVTCEVGGGSFRPVVAPPMPAGVKQLIITVKEYERLTVESIERKSRDAAIAALAVHPLVGGEPRAVELYKRFSEAQPRYFSGWK